jgi:hypothetical protein
LSIRLKIIIVTYGLTNVDTCFMVMKNIKKSSIRSSLVNCVWAPQKGSPTTKLGCWLADNRHILKPNYHKLFEVNEYQTTQSRREGGEVVIFTGAQTSKGGPRERNLPLFESYFKILPGPRIKSTILSMALKQPAGRRRLEIQASWYIDLGGIQTSDLRRPSSSHHHHHHHHQLLWRLERKILRKIKGLVIEEIQWWTLRNLQRVRNEKSVAEVETDR